MVTRPQPIKSAVALLALSILAGLVRNIFTIHWKGLSDPKALVVFIVSFLFLFGPIVLVTYKIYEGRNWARFAAVIVTGLNMLPYLSSARAMLPAPIAYFYFTQAIIQTIVVVLLFWNTSNIWFRNLKLSTASPNKSRQTELRDR